MLWNKTHLGIANNKWQQFWTQEEELTIPLIPLQRLSIDPETALHLSWQPSNRTSCLGSLFREASENIWKYVRFSKLFYLSFKRATIFSKSYFFLVEEILVANRNLFGNTFGENSKMYWEIFGEEVFSPTKRALTDASSFNTFPWKTFRIQHILWISNQFCTGAFAWTLLRFSCLY